VLPLVYTGTAMLLLLLLCACLIMTKGFVLRPSLRRPGSHCLGSKDEEGVFRLPDNNDDANSSSRELTSPSRDTPWTEEEMLLVEDAMLRAFDNLQDFEIRKMHFLIFRGNTDEHINVQQNLASLARRMALLQAEVNRIDELPFGVMESLQDDYRSTISQVRMYGKQAEFFLESGDVVEPSERGGFRWPWKPRT